MWEIGQRFEKERGGREKERREEKKTKMEKTQGIGK